MIAESRAASALHRIGQQVPAGQVMPNQQSGGSVGVYDRSTYGGGDVYGAGVGKYGTACYDCGACYEREETPPTGRYDRGAYYDRGTVYA